jgi:hypothetical protein
MSRNCADQTACLHKHRRSPGPDRRCRRRHRRRCRCSFRAEQARRSRRQCRSRRPFHPLRGFALPRGRRRSPRPPRGTPCRRSCQARLTRHRPLRGPTPPRSRRAPPEVPSSPWPAPWTLMATRPPTDHRGASLQCRLLPETTVSACSVKLEVVPLAGSLEFQRSRRAPIASSRRGTHSQGQHENTAPDGMAAANTQASGGS